MILCFGAACGAGLNAFLFLLLLWLGLASAASLFVVDAAVIVGLLLAHRRFAATAQETREPPATPGRPGWLAGLLAAGIGIVFLTFWDSTSARPHGDWDAFSLWNVRAKYLAGPGENWRTAVNSF